MNKRTSQIRNKSRMRGFSMVELLFAMSVLAVALLGGMAMIMLGVGMNAGNRMDTTATNVAQTFLEDIASAPPNNNPTLSLADCNQTSWSITTSTGGAPVLNGDIDFTQAPVGGYQANYVVCGNNGVQATYDVRWRVDPVAGSTWAKLVTVSARQPLAVRNGAIFYTPPVTLRTVVGM